MWQLALPVVETVLGIIRERKTEIAQETGVPSHVVAQISQAFEAHIGKDERLLAMAQQEMQAAREHDAQTQVRDIPFVNLARGLVRPSVTFMAMGWYVYARVQNIPLNAEDYAIIGGILAFWFGMRPFEKRQAHR